MKTTCNIKKLKTIKSEKGFTLFIALVLSGILLAVGFSLGNIILKQLLLSSTVKDSQVAFYAADSAAECALYWDRKDENGESVTDSVFSPVNLGPGGTRLEVDIRCGTGPEGYGLGRVAGFTTICNGGGPNGCDASATAATTTFYVDYRNPLNSSYRACAFVTVSKNNPSPNVEDTRIDSRGYNAPLRIMPGTGEVGTGSSGGSFLAINGECDLSNPRTVERGLLIEY